MDIIISDEMKTLVPQAALGVMSYQLQVNKSTADLLAYFAETVKKIEHTYETADIATMPQVKATREAYKALGKSPSQYRNAAETMLRRIVKGKGLYRINNAVEINNLISILSGYSIGSYGQEKLMGEVILCRASSGESYQGIGKAQVNIENLPVLYDEQGPFGNPTSDSERAMIQNGDRNIISFIYSFSQDTSALQQWFDKYRELLDTYTTAENITTNIISG